MISNTDFHLAKDILHRIANPGSCSPFQGKFSDEYKDQEPILTALKIIHKAVLQGSSDQQRELSRFRHEIVLLNSLLATNQLTQRIQSTFGWTLGTEAQELKNMKIALPPSSFEKMMEVATRIPRLIFSLLTDIFLLPVAGFLVLFMLTKPTFDPVKPKKAVPILLLHGSGFNESEWILGRQLLKKEQYGSVFSLNYDGLVTNDSTKGIDDYAATKVRSKILQIKQLTGQDRLVIVGYSMGGMIAGYYAEFLAHQDGMKIEHVMSIASPWKGSPTIDRFILGPKAAKRYWHMSSCNEFRQKLVAKAQLSERRKERKYYSMGSTTDLLVPARVSILTEDPRRQCIFSYLGHYGIIIAPEVWKQVRIWLDAIYAKEQTTRAAVAPLLC